MISLREEGDFLYKSMDYPLLLCVPVLFPINRNNTICQALRKVARLSPWGSLSFETVTFKTKVRLPVNFGGT